MKALKKNLIRIMSLLVGVLMGILVVLEMGRMGLTDLPPGEYLLSLLGVLLVIYLVFFLHIIAHEAGHLVCGLLTGYRFSSFRIASFTWIRQDGRIRFKRFTLAGTGGQCLLIPPELIDGKMPYLLYNLGGCLANLIVALLCLPALLLLEAGLLHLILALGGTVGVYFALLNGIPMIAVGIPNDGYNIRSIQKHPGAMRAFWIKMKINENQADGIRLKDMPSEWFDMPAEQDMENPMCSDLAVLRAGRLMDQHALEEAAQCMAHLVENSKAGKIKIAGIHLNLLACDRILCELLGRGDREAVDALLTKEVRTTMKQMKNMIAIVRTEYALALLHDNKPQRAERLLATFEKLTAKYPHPAEVEAERELMQLVKEKKANDSYAYI